MKLAVVDKSNKKVGDLEMPPQFSEEVRLDLIHKAVIVVQNNNRQQYGADPMAGNKASSYLSKRRHSYRGSYGFGISRTPRKILTRRGRRMYWVGATAPNTRGGRRSHPPKSEKIFSLDMPIKERRKAIRSAMAATLDKELAALRGHKVPDAYPFVVDDSICKVSKTKELLDALKKIGFEADLKRAEDRKVRAGIGKLRGRKYKTKKSLLIVVKDKCAVQLSARNVPGVEIAEVAYLNAELLAPGTYPGRLTVWTKGALELLKEKKVYM